jgi:hypothetical protein
MRTDEELLEIFRGAFEPSSARRASATMASRSTLMFSTLQERCFDKVDIR